jgi:hypothetical protein
VIAGEPDNGADFSCASFDGLNIFFPKNATYEGKELKIDYINKGHGYQLVVEGLVTVPRITEYYCDKIKNKSRYLKRNIKLAKE